MNRIFHKQTLPNTILQKNVIINWAILGSLILIFILSTNTSFATCYGNVNDGGEIGSSQTICSSASITLTNEDLPSGGYGNLEYLWLSNTSGPNVSGSNSYFSTSPTYSTGVLTETTWFRRCSRRNGCSSWSYGESNWVKVTIGNAEFEHVDGVNESACDANDGKIITDPYINQGTELPYSVEYTYNGQIYTAGPYSVNQDNYITDLAPGVYSDITIIDANNCSSVWGSDITISKYNIGCTATIGDWVFNDANGNGIQEASETGIQGITVTLINTDDNSSKTTITNQNGNYEFPEVTPGSYKLTFPKTDSSNGINYNLTPANQGLDQYKDSDPIPTNDGSGDAMTEIFLVSAGDQIDTIDAGYYIGSTITGIAFIETDLDGIQNGMEAKLDDVTVMLIDSNENTISTTTTANGGSYEFTNLSPGNYKVKFPKVSTVGSTNYSLTQSEIGSDDDIDSDAVSLNNGSGNAITQTVYVQNGGTVDNLDAGYYPLARIGDRVFQDVNEDGILDNDDDLPYADVNIRILGTDVFGNIINKETTPDAYGNYEFTEIVPGTYELEFTSNQVNYIPTIKDFSGNAYDNEDSDISQNTGRTDLITVNPGDNNKTIYAGFIVDSSLPVELLNFEAQLVNGNQVLLKWITASEINNRHFVVERSVDGSDFRPIGLVEGHGTTNLLNHYSLDDIDPFYGANYYRLKQVDFNGDAEYSNIETVIVSGNNLPDVIVYPNPVIKTTTLRVVTPFETDAQIEIVNLTGQVIKTLTIEAGANSKQIDFSDFTAGVYYAYINYNGHRTLVHNIIKVDE